MSRRRMQANNSTPLGIPAGCRVEHDETIYCWIGPPWACVPLEQPEPPSDEQSGCDECDDRYGYDGQPCDRHQGIYEERKRIEAILRDGLRLYASSTESFGDALRWALRAIAPSDGGAP